jgi:hypothetical protein
MVVGAWVRKLRYGDGITFGWFLFLSSLLLFLGSRRSTMASAQVFTTFGVSLVEVVVSHMPCLPRGCPEWYQSVAGLMSSYAYVHSMIVSVFSLHFIPTLVRDYAAQEVCI